MRIEVVLRRPTARERRQRQSTLRVEFALDVTNLAMQRAHRRGQGHRVVSTSTRLTRQRRRYRRPMHSVLEHRHQHAVAVRRHRFAGVQLGLEQERERDRQHARLQPKSNRRLALSEYVQAHHAHGPHPPRALSRHFSRRPNHRHRRRRRDVALLERLPRHEVPRLGRRRQHRQHARAHEHSMIHRILSFDTNPSVPQTFFIHSSPL